PVKPLAAAAIGGSAVGYPGCSKAAPTWDVIEQSVPSGGEATPIVHAPNTPVDWAALYAAIEPILPHIPAIALAGSAFLIWRELRRFNRARVCTHGIDLTEDHEEAAMVDPAEAGATAENTLPKPDFKLLVGGASHTGKVRAENQDAYTVREVGPGNGLAIVCDGVGGHPGGRAAARYAARKLKGRFEMGLIVGLDPEEALEEALGHVAEQMAADGIEGLTTALITHLDGERLTWAGLGDGRIAVIHRDGMHQDLMAPHHALDQPSNVITAHLEAGKIHQPRLGSLRIAPGTLVFAMSDGAGDLLDLSAMAKNRQTYLRVLRQIGPELFCGQILDRLESLTIPGSTVPLHSDNLTITVAMNTRAEDQE
ncbi:MAG: protein phosphatase 2C domain-containing protein, partial [Pseudomonadota bacterium]